MIHAEQMEQSVQHQNSKFIPQAVLQPGGLLPCASHRNSQIPRSASVPCRKGEYVGRIIAAEELSIQPLKFAVIREKTRERPSGGNLRTDSLRELAQLAL